MQNVTKHKVLGLIVLGLMLAGPFLFAGCDIVSNLWGKKPASSSNKRDYYAPEGKIVAKVNDMVITLEELENYIKTYNQQIEDFKKEYPDLDIGLKKVETTEEKLERLNSDLVRQRLLYQEALDTALDRKADIKKALESFKMSLLVAALIKEKTDNIKVTATEIEDYYNKNKNSFREAEERRARLIMAKSQAQANNALIEVLQGTDFSEVARKYSVDKSASSGGDLGFIEPGTRFPQFDIEVYTLEVGAVSRVFKDPNAGDYYIVKVEEKRGGKEMPLMGKLWDDIKAKLEQDRQKEVIDALVGKLQREAKIDIKTSEIK